jgi:hypothetical protein
VLLLLLLPYVQLCHHCLRYLIRNHAVIPVFTSAVHVSKLCRRSSTCSMESNVHLPRHCCGGILETTRTCCCWPVGLQPCIGDIMQLLLMLLLLLLLPVDYPILA